jgi:hypothetical protein
VTWFKVDDDFYDHPKVKGIPKRARPGAIALWTMAGSWCARYLMDGIVPGHQVSELGSLPKDAQTLVDVGLWLIVPGGYQFHDWSAYQPSRAQVEEEREKARKRMQRRRSSGEHDNGQAP